jgi:hypothetical protein
VRARTALACNYYCFFSFAGSVALDEEELAAGALVEPPAAESFFVASAEPEVELEPDGELGVVEPADEDDEPG